MLAVCAGLGLALLEARGWWRRLIPRIGARGNANSGAPGLVARHQRSIAWQI
jgi:hypothetical protein